MGLRDEIDVLFEREVYEADLSCGAVNIQEAGSPFEYIQKAIYASTGQTLSESSYVRTAYVNNVNSAYTQVLMEPEKSI